MRRLRLIADAHGLGLQKRFWRPSISGSVYWTDPGYYVDGVGSSVLLDEEKNLELFSELAKGTHKAGAVGTLAEQQG